MQLVDMSLSFKWHTVITTGVSCAETAEPTETLFGVRGQTQCWPKDPCIKWGSRYHRMGTFDGGYVLTNSKV